MTRVRVHFFARILISSSLCSIRPIRSPHPCPGHQPPHTLSLLSLNQTYLTTLVPGAPVPGAFPITTVHLALVVLLLPWAGHLADRLGFYPVMLAGGIFLGAASPVAFYILRLGTPAAAFCGQALFVAGFALHVGPLGLFLTDFVTTSPHLYTAIALVYNIPMVRTTGARMHACMHG